MYYSLFIVSFSIVVWWHRSTNVGGTSTNVGISKSLRDARHRRRPCFTSHPHELEEFKLKQHQALACYVREIKGMSLNRISLYANIPLSLSIPDSAIHWIVIFFNLRKVGHMSKVKWEGAPHPYLQLGELNCEGRSSRGLVEGILKAPRAAALRPNVTEHSYDGRVGWVSILILNQRCQNFKWEESGVPGENLRLLVERWPPLLTWM